MLITKRGKFIFWIFLFFIFNNFGLKTWQFMKSIIQTIIKILKKKYLLTSVLFITWVFFFDGNNLVDRASALRTLHQLERDKKYYAEKIISDSKKLEELKTNNDNLEKFAREQYLMKKENEDIFVIIDKNKED